MDKSEFKSRLRSGNHKIAYCKLCRYPMIVCGHCAMNTCSGGIGDNCKDNCEEAYALFYADYYPMHMRIRAWIDAKIHRIFLRIKVLFERS